MSDFDYHEEGDQIRGCAILLSMSEAAELAVTVRTHLPKWTAVACVLEEMGRDEMDVLCLQLMDSKVNDRYS